MSSTIISEPFQLYLGSTTAQKIHNFEAIYTSHNRDFPAYATVTAQEDGIHVLDLENLHAVASYSVGGQVTFAIPAFSLYVTEDGNKSVIHYALIGGSPGLPKGRRKRTFWVIRQTISGSTVSTSEKTVVPVDIPPVRICGTGHPTTPLLLVSKSGSLFLVDAQVDIKVQLDWPGEREHLETFVFSRKSCSFIQHDTDPYSSVAVTCCQSSVALHVRVVLLGEEIVPIGTCEIEISTQSPTGNTNAIISGVTCSSSGVLSFIDRRGIWATYQLISLNSSLVWTPVSENLHVRRFSMLKRGKSLARDCFSVVSLGTSLVLVAALVEDTRDLSLQIWDLSYGVLLAAQSMPVPSAIPNPHLSLTVADEGQVLLTVSTSLHDKRVGPKRSSIYIVPVDARLKSTIAAALGKAVPTAEWLVPKKPNKREPPPKDDESARIIYKVRELLKDAKVQQAEQAFLTWVDSRSSKETAFGYEFVKKIFNVILAPEYPSPARITRCLLENAVVSTIMLNGRLLTTLRQRGDWENLMLALTTVVDISEDELMASAKVLVDRQRRSENAMDVDTTESYAPPLWSYLFACVSYPFSAAPMRLAIRKHLPDAQDLVMILEVLEIWIQGGTEHEMEVLLRSLAANTDMPSSQADSPPYPKVIMFLHALLDASFVALLQYQPSYELLRRILSYIEPEITFIDGLESLRGVLEPFVKVQLGKEKTGAFQETLTEWKKKKKQLQERASLNVGLYRLEELTL